MSTTTLTENRAGLYFLYPTGTDFDCYAAGYEGNVFESKEAAVNAIPGLRACGPEFDHEWSVARYPGEAE